MNSFNARQVRKNKRLDHVIKIHTKKIKDKDKNEKLKKQVKELEDRIEALEAQVNIPEDETLR